MNRTPCMRCGAMILEMTSKANEGLCAPCSKGGGICEICGTRMPQSNKNGRFVCWDCEKSQRIERVPTLPKQWKKISDVDWLVVANNYALAIESLLLQFLSAQNHDPAYGAVFQLSQNGMLDVHINTRNGLTGIPEKMRKIANWGREFSDEEWIAKVGIWYTPAWKYDNLNSIFFENELARAIADFHYELYEMLFNSEEDDDKAEGIEAKIDEARLSAIKLVRDSDAFRSIDKAQEFAVYITDDDGLNYETKKHILD
jgi:hypothetical protein